MIHALFDWWCRCNFYGLQSFCPSSGSKTNSEPWYCYSYSKLTDFPSFSECARGNSNQSNSASIIASRDEPIIWKDALQGSHFSFVAFKLRSYFCIDYYNWLLRLRMDQCMAHCYLWCFLLHKKCCSFKSH